MTASISKAAECQGPPQILKPALPPKAATALPIVDMAQGNRRQLGEEVAAACHSTGMFYLVNHGLDNALLDAVLDQCSAFFNGAAHKEEISIKRSSNFRGFGILKNERDWREQIHLGIDADLPPDIRAQTDPAKYWRLWGRNQWPFASGSADQEKFKSVISDYFQAVEGLSRQILECLATALELRSQFFTERMLDRPYLLIKAMSYYPQERSLIDSSCNVERPGVTAHCDWSWLTFLLQDDVGGLEAQDTSGKWHSVEPLKNALVVNTGELLELESGGFLRASPHRVVNSRIDRQRYSVPLFINPALDSMIYPSESYSVPGSQEHIHKVIEPGTCPQAFVFGDSEWQRKGLGQWCYRQHCLD